MKNLFFSIFVKGLLTLAAISLAGAQNISENYSKDISISIVSGSSIEIKEVLESNRNITLVPDVLFRLRIVFRTANWHPTDDIVAINLESKTGILDLRTGKMYGFLGGGGLAAWSPDGRKIATVPFIPTGLDLWEYPSNRWLGKISEFPSELTAFRSISWSPDSNRLAASSCGAPPGGSGIVYIFEASTLSLVRTINFSRCIQAIEWDPSGLFIAGVEPEGDVHLIDSARGIEVKNRRATTQDSRFLLLQEPMAWNPTGRQLAIAHSLIGSDITVMPTSIEIYDVLSGQTIQSIHRSDLPHFSWSLDGRHLITVDNHWYYYLFPHEERLEIWDSESGQLVTAASLSGQVLALSPSGRSAIVAPDSGDSLQILEVRLSTPGVILPKMEDASLNRTQATPQNESLSKEPSKIPTQEFSTSNRTNIWLPIAATVAAGIIGWALFGRVRRSQWLEGKVLQLEALNVDVGDVRKAIGAPGRGSDAIRLAKEKLRLLAEEGRLQGRIRDVESCMRKIAAKLAEGKLSEAAFGAENRRLEVERAELREKLVALHQKLYKEKYEKPVF